MMRFDPGYYDMGPVGIRKRGGSYQSKTKKIDLSTKEPVELRKADKRWVRPGEQEDDLAKAEKETQVTFDGSNDSVIMVIYIGTVQEICWHTKQVDTTKV